MAFSGIIKDDNRGFLARGSFPVRMVTFTLFAALLGWVFSTYMPQISELALRFAAGIGIGLGLILITFQVSKDRGERMFAAIFFACGFIAGMWGMWVNAEFGDVPSLDELRASAANATYAVTLFGEPTVFDYKIFEMWIAVTAIMASVPFLASLAKPAPAGTRHNPFHVHADFAQPFGKRLIMLPLLGFAIAAGAVYGLPHLAAYNLPIELALVAPLVAAFLYTKLHMTFVKALIISGVGGIAGAAGFWVPWLYMKDGQAGLIAFVQGTPQDILARIQTLAEQTGYTSEITGTTVDYSPWTFEIWAGLTLAFLILPVLVILLRRVMFTLRPV